MNTHESIEYKKSVAELYSRRSRSYDRSEWHDRMARNIVDYAEIKSGSKVLDIATGTGMVAFYAASKTGSDGAVIGIDISEGMIQISNTKLKSSEFSNIKFEIGDGETLAYEDKSFDYIFCGSVLIWMTDLQSALVHWRSKLKDTGKVGFHAFSENAFVSGVVAQSVLEKFGVSYLMNKPTGSVEKCEKLLTQAGYRNIDIKIDADGNYISKEDALNSWVTATHPAPGQFPHPMSTMTEKQISEAQSDFEREIEMLNTNRGIWNDMTTYYVFGKK